MSCDRCVPIRFGSTNDVPDATLVTSPAPVTDLENIKNELGARRVRWTDLSGEIVIEGELPEDRVFRYFSLPGNICSLNHRSSLSYSQPLIPVPTFSRANWSKSWVHGRLGTTSLALMATGLFRCRV